MVPSCSDTMAASLLERRFSKEDFPAFGLPTTENLGTGSSYDDEDVLGYTLGLGVKAANASWFCTFLPAHE